MMNDEQTAWVYVRHDATLRDHPSSTSSTWWKICDGQISQVGEADVLGDSNVVHFIVYTRQEGQSKKDEEGITTAEEAADESQEGGSKPSKNIRLDSVLDWWEKTPLVVSGPFFQSSQLSFVSSDLELF